MFCTSARVADVREHSSKILEINKTKTFVILWQMEDLSRLTCLLKGFYSALNFLIDPFCLSLLEQWAYPGGNSRSEPAQIRNPRPVHNWEFLILANPNWEFQKGASPIQEFKARQFRHFLFWASPFQEFPIWLAHFGIYRFGLAHFGISSFGPARFEDSRFSAGPPKKTVEKMSFLGMFSTLMSHFLASYSYSIRWQG